MRLERLICPECLSVEPDDPDLHALTDECMNCHRGVLVPALILTGDDIEGRSLPNNGPCSGQKGWSP